MYLLWVFLIASFSNQLAASVDKLIILQPPARIFSFCFCPVRSAAPRLSKDLSADFCFAIQEQKCHFLTVCKQPVYFVL